MESPNVICRFSAREFGVCARNRGVRHRVLLLACRERGVALGADLRAYVVASGSVSLAWPPSGFSEVFLAAELLTYGCRHLGRRHRH